MAGETYTTYDQVGIAEDISDVISNISPTKTPFQTSIGSEKIDNRLFQWQEDSLRAVIDNKALEGFVAADVARTATTLRSNYTQILSDVFRISSTADAVRTYGRAKETAYQLAKTGEELKRDLENAFVGMNNAAVAGVETTTAREMASALNMIDAGNVIAGGTAALTETMILNCHKACFDAGGEPEILMIKPADALIVAGFAAASGRQRDFGAAKTITNVVDLYVSPWGELKVVLNRFLLSTVAFMYDPNMYKKAVLRNWSRERLSKDGDAERHMVVGEFSLKHKNFKSSGYVNAIT
jgi:hypothetical protein